MFPAPREVDRELYPLIKSKEYRKGIKFPAPREVDRYLYDTINTKSKSYFKFPAPREVDR